MDLSWLNHTVASFLRRGPKRTRWFSSSEQPLKRYRTFLRWHVLKCVTKYLPAIIVRTKSCGNKYCHQTSGRYKYRNKRAPWVPQEVEEEVLVALLASDKVGANAVEVFVDARARFLLGTGLHYSPYSPSRDDGTSSLLNASDFASTWWWYQYAKK